MKNYLASILKVIVSLTIVNVWLFRFSKESVYRGGDSTDLITEFAAYGLSLPIMYLIGALKVIAALALLGSVFSKISAQIPLLVIAALMTAAIYFHFSIGDPLMKSFPAALMLGLCILIFFLQKNSVRQ
ncbi:MAG: DoxX family protein [Flavobacteriia bacterium]|jgi:uncharacterized membrane protein (UPF0182 family)|nr:DoxX family protein [Flavobacteriia bacterium]